MRFDADDAPAAGRPEHQIVEDEAQIGLSGADIGEHRVVRLFQRGVQSRTQKLRQVDDLRELAPRIRVQRSIARQNMKRLQERDRLLRMLARPELAPGLLVLRRRVLALHPSSVA
jgi:hypothetical protein